MMLRFTNSKLNPPHIVGCILIFSFLIAQNKVEGLECYACNSHDDSRCGWDKLPEVMKRNCTEMEFGKENNMCRKIVQIIEFEVNGMPPEKRVIRSCGREDLEKNKYGKCYIRSGFGGRQKVCTCPKDNCNSSTKIGPGILATFISTFLFYKLA